LIQELSEASLGSFNNKKSRDFVPLIDFKGKAFSQMSEPADCFVFHVPSLSLEEDSDELNLN